MMAGMKAEGTSLIQQRIPWRQNHILELDAGMCTVFSIWKIVQAAEEMNYGFAGLWVAEASWTVTGKRDGSLGVTARVWCRGGIDRKRNSTINLTTDTGACFWCLPQTSPLTPDVTTNNFFSVQRGTPKYIWNNHNNYIFPRLTLLIKIFIHTYNHSFTVLSAKSINTVSLPWKLSDFLDTSFSWTLSFPLGPYFSSFSLGTF